MDSLELQEKTIYTHLHPLLLEQGFEAIQKGKLTENQSGKDIKGTAIAIPGMAVPGTEFRKTTSGGFKSVMFSFGNNEGEQVLNIHLGVRFNIVESLVSQFLKEEGPQDDQHTIIASLHRFNRPPLPKLLITDECSLRLACKQVKDFMQKKGFRFLNTFDKLKRADASLNRKPNIPSPYIPNQIHRCFKGIVLARLLQRTNFDVLCSIYLNYLRRQKAPEGLTENYLKLVNYLKCFSFN